MDDRRFSLLDLIAIAAATIGAAVLVGAVAELRDWSGDKTAAVAVVVGAVYVSVILVPWLVMRHIPGRSHTDDANRQFSETSSGAFSVQRVVLVSSSSTPRSVINRADHNVGRVQLRASGTGRSQRVRVG